MDAPAVDRLVQRQGLGLGGVVGGVVDGIGGVVCVFCVLFHTHIDIS